MKKNRKNNIWIWGTVVFVCVLVVIVVGQVVLPPIASEKIDVAIRPFFADAKDLQIDISATPAIKMLFGRFDSVTIRAEDFILADIPIKTLMATANNVVINQRVLQSENPFGNADITMVMTTEQVQERFISQIPSLSNFQVSFSHDTINILGTVNVFGLILDIDASGKLIVLSNNVVSFDIQEINIDNSNLGNTVVNLAKELIKFQFSVGDLPWGIRLLDIDIDEDYITFYGYIRK